MNDPDPSMTALPVEEALFLHNAVVSEPPRLFRFASGLESPVYIDSRRLISYPSERDRIVAALAAAARAHFPETNAVVGIATGAIAWAAWIAAELALPLLYARGAAKDRGLGRLLEGDLPEQPRALVVEDLVTTGGSCLKAVDALQAEGATCTGVLSLFSYELPYAREAFAKRGVVHFSLGTLSGLLTITDKGLSDAAVQAIEQWRDNVLPDFQPTPG